MYRAYPLSPRLFQFRDLQEKRLLRDDAGRIAQLEAQLAARSASSVSTTKATGAKSLRVNWLAAQLSSPDGIATVVGASRTIPTTLAVLRACARHFSTQSQQSIAERQSAKRGKAAVVAQQIVATIALVLVHLSAKSSDVGYKECVDALERILPLQWRRTATAPRRLEKSLRESTEGDGSDDAPLADSDGEHDDDFRRDDSMSTALIAGLTALFHLPSFGGSALLYDLMTTTVKGVATTIVQER